MLWQRGKGGHSKCSVLQYKHVNDFTFFSNKINDSSGSLLITPGVISPISLLFYVTKFPHSGESTR
uniref:Uncharacterized protein n=1 Tax=Anguilla anguilla TaxID=7936 RepID=A0A0E9QH37_ANGAN